MATDVNLADMTSAIRVLTETLDGLLRYGRESVQESKDEFINGKITKLFGMASAYNNCFKRLGVATKLELESWLHRHSKDTDLRELGIELLDHEQEWDTFLTDIDNTIEGDFATVKVGQTGPIMFPLVDARTGERTSLDEYLKDTDSLVLVLLRHFA